VSVLLVAGRAPLSVALVLALAACGDDGSTTDTGVVDAGTDAPDGSSDVLLPALPVLTPCPPGWREVMVPDVPVPVCDPWPSGEPTPCADGEAHFPGEAGCVTVGPACPTGRFPEGLPGDRTIRYVDGSAAPGGDGSMASPYQLVANALRDSGSGDIVAVAKGTYDEDVSVRGGITIWGACATETRLTSSRSGVVDAIVDVQRADVEIRGVSIGGARPAIIVSSSEGGLTLDGVLIDQSALLGVGVSAGTLIAREVVFRDITADASGNFGSCVLAQNGATATLSRVIVERCVSAGLTIDDEGTTVRIEDSRIHDINPRPAGDLGRGASFQTGSHGELERVVVDGTHELGVIASGPGTLVTASDLYVRDTLPQEDGFFGHGLTAQREGSLTIRKSRIEQSHEAALLFVRSGPNTLEDVVIHDTQPQEVDDEYGFGIASLDAPISASRVLVATSHNSGVTLEGPEVVATFADLTVVSTRSAVDDGRFGRGFNVQNGPAVDVTRARFTGNRDVSVATFGAAARFVDLTVESTMARACGETTCSDQPFGIGVGVYREADVDIESFSVSGSFLAGIQLAESSELDLQRGVVAENPIGVNVQVSGYDLMRLSDRVVYRDNGTNLDAMDLPVPGIADSVQDP